MKNLSRFGQPTYYFGNSILRLALHRLIASILILRRRGPSPRVLKNLRSLRKSKSGKYALVLGNGPSLNKLNLENLREFNPEIFALNDYYLKDIANDVIPNFYCLSDPDSFVQPDRMVRHNNSRMMNYIESHGSTLLIPHFYRKFNLRIANRIIYFNDREFQFLNRNINPCFPRSYSSLTVLKALSVAIYLGYEKIYILGVDNTEFRALGADQNGNYWLDIAKLYEDSSSNLRYPVYSETGIAGKFQQYAAWFADFHKFPKNRIYNLDTSSLIDAFPKVSEIS